jgi:hypothetical protein
MWPSAPAPASWLRRRGTERTRVCRATI